MNAYLLALEISPVEVGMVYEGLPLHCTLVHWFWAESSEAVAESMRRVAQVQGTLALDIEEEEQFTGMTNSGPVPVVVNKVKKTPAIASLHETCVKMLDAIGVTYSMPQYIHEGYVPHVTHQKGGRLKEGEAIQVESLYLAEADDPAYGNDRTIIETFPFQYTEASL